MQALAGTRNATGFGDDPEVMQMFVIERCHGLSYSSVFPNINESIFEFSIGQDPATVRLVYCKAMEAVMKCPVCTTVNLSMSDRQGVEIDYCPQCRGVWLDRGELDKLIDRAQAVSQAPQQPARQQAAIVPQHAPQRSDERHVYAREHHPDYRSRKKKGFLGEFFDF